MNLTSVTEMLRAQIGLAPESLGPTALARAVEARMRTRGLTTAAADSAVEAYAACLAADAQEFEALVDALTVPETWFFRGGEIFATLARRIAEHVRAQPAGKPFRVLSVPCSTGEEPYSLAIALAEQGVPPARVRIEGVDLCARSIERARAARYTEFSFRQTGPELRSRYFRPAEGGWRLGAETAAVVHFRQGNLVAPLFLVSDEPYDLIFCRNLLIYLTPAARQRALETLDRLLAPGGLLCMGHAEPLEFLGSSYVRTGPHGCFLYERAAVAPAAALTRASSPAPAPALVPPARVAAIASRAPRPAIPPPPKREPPAPQPEPADALESARALADRGQIDEALASCQAKLAHSGSSAHLYTLMGVLHLARQEGSEAEHCFERALYLDPAHRDALTHLMLLRQQQGDHAQAARLRRRLDRVGPGGEK